MTTIITKSRRKKMFNNFQRPTITDENIKKSITDVIGAFNRKLENKGKGALISLEEILGKLTEEYFEVEEEVHENKRNSLKNELTDVAIVCLWGIASIEQSYNE